MTQASSSSSYSFTQEFTNDLTFFRLPSSNSNSTSLGYSSFLSNFFFFDDAKTTDNNLGFGKNKARITASSLGLPRHSGGGGGGSASRVLKFFNEFNRAVKFQFDSNPFGFGISSAAALAAGCYGGVHGGPVSEGETMLPLNGVGESNGQKKVLILMSDTGGGHRASAEAIKYAFNQEFGDEYQVFVTDLWTDHTPWPFNQLPRSYNFLVKHGPLWRMTYYGSAPRLVHQSNFAATSAFIAREVANGLMKYQPDIIISVHPLMQHVPLRILRSKGLLEKIVFTTVVTDLSTCHPTWFHKLVTRCYCPTDEVAKRALKAGVKPSQLKVYGLPVRPSFVKPVRPKALDQLLQPVIKCPLVSRQVAKSYPTVVFCFIFLKDVALFLSYGSDVHAYFDERGIGPIITTSDQVPPRFSPSGKILSNSGILFYFDELRKDLGMDEDLPAVLLMGGGEGMGPIEATAKALGKILYDENLEQPIGQVLVICGRNKKLANKLLSADWKIPIQVKGFVTKMEECMGACDCIITKAGPGTIAEAMIRGLPIILNDYIAGQEVGNVPYVVENGCGKYSKSPKEIANIVAQWFGPKADELKAMSNNALRLARPDSVFKIVHDLHELVKQNALSHQYAST